MLQWARQWARGRPTQGPTHLLPQVVHQIRARVRVICAWSDREQNHRHVSRHGRHRTPAAAAAAVAAAAVAAARSCCCVGVCRWCCGGGGELPAGESVVVDLLEYRGDQALLDGLLGFRVCVCGCGCDACILELGLQSTPLQSTGCHNEAPHSCRDSSKDSPQRSSPISNRQDPTHQQGVLIPRPAGFKRLQPQLLHGFIFALERIRVLACVVEAGMRCVELHAIQSFCGARCRGESAAHGKSAASATHTAKCSRLAASSRSLESFPVRSVGLWGSSLNVWNAFATPSTAVLLIHSAISTVGYHNAIIDWIMQC